MNTILIVDDKDDNLYYLKSLLGAHGFTVEQARHGVEALNMARAAPPVLIITDLLMPVMDGYTLIRRCQADAQLSAIPIMVYTATYISGEDEQLALDLGADAFLVKPAEPDAFMVCVQDVLAGKSRARLTPDQRPADPTDLVERYNATLVRKLEQRTAELEQVNRALRKEMAERANMEVVRAAILDSLTANVALLDANGVIVAVNSAWQGFGDANGLSSPSSGVGANYIDVCAHAQGEGADQAWAVAQGIRDVISGAIPEYSLEYPCGTVDEVSWFRVTVTPVRNATAPGAVVTHFDITEVKRAEESSRVFAERLAVAVDAASIGIWEWSSDGTDVWSDRMYDIYGMARGSKVNYEIWSAMVHPEDRETQKQRMQNLIAVDGARESIIRILPRNGTQRYIQSIEKVSKMEKGQIARIVGTNVDITDRYLREAQIREANTRFETLISEATIGILVHRNFVPVTVNAELARILGYEGAAELLAMPDCRAMFAEEDRPFCTETNSALIAGERTVSGHFAIRGCRKDGSTVDLENRSFAIIWDGEICICSMLTDVTDQRKLEAQLRQSQRLEAVGQMTGGVAHDFNNLLTVILGNGELLQEALHDNPDLRVLAEMTVTAADRGAELAGQLLAFSRQQVLDAKAVDVNTLITQMQGLLQRAVGMHIDIRISGAGALWSALVDAAQLETALLNLCVNARDAMPDGGQITIETRNVELTDTIDADRDIVPGDYVLLAVSDTGSGMDEATRLHAFDPFFTTKDVGKGSGLGLSMVYGFIKQTGGHIRIYSEQGYGTTVKMYLPRADGSAKPFEPALPAPEVLGGTEKILVVEDDELVRRQVVEQLSALGYDVVSAKDGVEALDVLNTMKDFALLFTDVVMPRGLNGRQLANAAVSIYPDLVVVFTSGYTENAIFEEADLERGVTLLNKPYRRQDLSLKIRMALDKAAGR